MRIAALLVSDPDGRAHGRRTDDGPGHRRSVRRRLPPESSLATIRGASPSARCACRRRSSSTAFSTSRSTATSRRSATSSSRSRARVSRPPRRRRCGSSYDRQYLYVSARDLGVRHQPARRDRDAARRQQPVQQRSLRRDVRLVLRPAQRLRLRRQSAGGMLDWSITNEQPNNSWNGVWMCGPARFEGGWTVEIRFPFRSFRFREGGTHLGHELPPPVGLEERGVVSRARCRPRGAGRRCRGCRSRPRSPASRCPRAARTST